MKKNDVWLIAVILIIAAVIFIYTQNSSLKGDHITVTLEGEVISSYPLNEPVEIELHGETEGYNRLIIEKGTAYIKDADCPDRLCVHQQAISKNGESITCLPHRIVITVISAEEASLDAVAN